MIEDFDEEEIDFDIKLSEIKSLDTFASKKLCDIIVCYRYLGMNKDLAINCMEELGKRRLNGDKFEFETYIDNAMKDMPTLDMKIPDLNTVLRQLGGKFSK